MPPTPTPEWCALHEPMHVKHSPRVNILSRTPWGRTHRCEIDPHGGGGCSGGHFSLLHVNLQREPKSDSDRFEMVRANAAVRQPALPPACPLLLTFLTSLVVSNHSLITSKGLGIASPFACPHASRVTSQDFALFTAVCVHPRLGHTHTLLLCRPACFH